MNDKLKWFAPKRYGLGAGLPIAWQGWAVLALYAGVTVGSFFLFGERHPASYAVLAIATAILIIISAKTTEGGWHWRWGGSDE